MSPLNITQQIKVYGLLDGYYKVMSNIPKMAHLPTPEKWWWILQWFGVRENFTEPVSTLKDIGFPWRTSINNEKLKYGRSISKDYHEQKIKTNMYMILRIYMNNKI